MILDFGCRTEKIPGATGVDIDPDSDAEVIHDLNVCPFPFEDNSVDKIYAKHIIEHLDDPIMFIKEIWRILKPGGTVFIETPHFSNYVAFSEPQHKFFYSYFTFRNILDYSKKPFKILQWELTFYKTFRALGIKYLANKFPETYERFWTFMFPAENIKLLIEKE